MPISDEKCLPRAAGKRPAWAHGKFFQCSLVTSDVLWKAPTTEDGGAEEVLAAYFYQVPGVGGGVNLGVQVLCKILTLYLVLEGMPNAFLALKQVCLAYGGVTDVAATGDSGCVVWSDSSIQRILRYDRVDPRADDLENLLRYARFLRHKGKPSFAELGTEEDTQSVGTSTITRMGPGCEGTEETGGMGTTNSEANSEYGARLFEVVEDGQLVRYGGKTFCFGGVRRWDIVTKLIGANGKYVFLGKGVKALFAKHGQAKAFFDAAVEAEGQGINGTGRYRLKI
mgnify:FL=1